MTSDKKSLKTEDKKEKSKEDSKKPIAEDSSVKYLGFVLIRSIREAEPDAKYTAQSLRLTRKNSLVLVKASPSFKGMLKRLKDYGAFAEISEASYNKIQRKKEPSYSSDSVQVYRCSPPRGGFKKSIKLPSPKGILGRKSEEDFMNLVSRMI